MQTIRDLRLGRNSGGASAYPPRVTASTALRVAERLDSADPRRAALIELAAEIDRRRPIRSTVADRHGVWRIAVVTIRSIRLPMPPCIQRVGGAA